MPTTVRGCVTVVAGAAAVVLLTACGGDGESSAKSSPAQTQAEQTSGSAGGDDFCAQAADLDQRVESALSDVEGDDPSVADAFRQLAEELRGIDAPEPIAADWDAMAAGLDRMAEAFTDLDITDSESLATLDQAEGDLSAASSNVETYLRDECGIEP
jgi:hypothetical protein